MEKQRKNLEWLEMLRQKQFEALKKVALELERASVKDWVLAGGGAGSFYGLKREPKDLDIGLGRRESRQGFAVAERVFGFPQAKWKSERGWKAFYSNGRIEGESVDFFTEIYHSIGNETVYFSVDYDTLKNRKEFDVLGVKVPAMPVEDLVFMKVVSQRGAKEGKTDLEDARELLELNAREFNWEQFNKGLSPETEAVKKRARDCVERLRLQ